MGKLNSLERTIGLEFEFSNPKTMTEVEVGTLAKVGCEWVNDGSLVNGGKELVTRPMRGDQFVSGVSAILALMLELTPEVDSHCGYHVHVGMKDANYLNLRNLILIWCGIERDVFKYLVQPGRDKGRYCIPLRTTKVKTNLNWQLTRAALTTLADLDSIEAVETDLITRFYGDRRRFEQVAGNKRAFGTGSHRYAALNLHSFFHRGTAEFRLKEGTLNMQECVYWPLFCGWLVENAMHMTVSEARSMTSLRRYLEAVKMPKRLTAWVDEKMAKEPEVVEEVEEQAQVEMPPTQYRQFTQPSSSWAFIEGDLRESPSPTPPAPLSASALRFSEQLAELRRHQREAREERRTREISSAFRSVPSNDENPSS